MANKIIIYSKTICPLCVMAKKLLQSKNLDYTEINIERAEGLREEMLEKSGGKKTVPQIFINNHYVGGYDDLKEADQMGRLDELLNKIGVNT